MPGSSQSARSRSAPHILLVLASVGLACGANATPIESPTEEAGPATLLPGRRGIEVEPGPGFSRDWDEEIAVEPFDSQPSEAGGDADADQRDAGSDRSPGPSRSELTQHQLDLARHQAREGNLEAAASTLEQVIEVDPSNAEAHAWLGSFLVASGRFAEGERKLMRAIELGGRSARVYTALARAETEQGRAGDAVHHGREALRLDPGSVPAANNLAWILATSSDPELRNPEEAIQLIERALRAVRGESPPLLDTLAAAYAAAGRFDDAIETARKAEALAQRRGLSDLAREIGVRLDRYRAGEPCVEC